MKKSVKKLLASVLTASLVFGTAHVLMAGSGAYESNGGTYKLSYILNHYNVFTKGNYVGSHVVGPVVVKGELSMTAVGGRSDGQPAPQDVPCYVLGKATLKGGDGGSGVYFRTENENIGTYLGTVNETLPVQCTSDSPITYTDELMDWDAAWADIQTTAESINGSVEIPASQITQILSEGWNYNPTDYDFYDTLGYKLELESPTVVKLFIKEGQSYSIPDSVMKNCNLYLQTDKTADTHRDTIITSKDDENYTLPKVFIDGVETGVGEGGEDGSSIVYVLPAAVQATAPNGITGHVVAPNAKVKNEGGFFNGCMVCAELDSEHGEGHMRRYYGETFDVTPTPTSTPTPTPTNTPTPTATNTPTPTSGGGGNANYPEWENKTYTGENVVSHNDKLYYHNGWINEEPGVGSNWKEVPVWDSSSSYNTNDVVQYNGLVYKASAYNGSGDNPPNINTKWVVCTPPSS